MARISAERLGAAPKTSRRKPKPSYDPLATRAKALADRVWENAMRIAEVLAPARPVDQEPIEEHDTWLLLEAVAAEVSPFSGMWDAYPGALHDLFELRKKFLPETASPRLEVIANRAEKMNALLPDPTITPANKDFEKRQNRLKGS